MDDYLLLSIKPKWVEKILSGEKTIELRKSKIANSPKKLLIYSTQPVGALVAEASIKEITAMYTSLLWFFTKEGQLAQTTDEEFWNYYGDKVFGTAIVLSDIKLIEPIPLAKLREVWSPWHPPQGIQYISTRRYESAIAG